MFKTQLSKTKDEENDVNNLTLEEAYKRYQKRKNNSSYSDFYGANVDEKYKYNNIFKYKDFDKVIIIISDYINFSLVTQNLSLKKCMNT